MGVSSEAPRAAYITADWFAKQPLHSGALSVEDLRLLNGHDSDTTDCGRITEEPLLLLLIYIFFIIRTCLIVLDIKVAMAVTEAGCDLTYCKMRGIVAVLTGEL